jgi:hypothetical protein
VRQRGRRGAGAGTLRRLPASRSRAGVTHARVHSTATPAGFLAALKCAAPLPNEQLGVGAKVELHSLNATEHNGKHGELLFYDERDSALVCRAQ